MVKLLHSYLVSLGPRFVWVLRLRDSRTMLKTGSASRGPIVFFGSFPTSMNAHAEAAGKGNVPDAEVDARPKLSLKSDTDFFGRSPLDVFSRLATAFHFPPILRAFGARYGNEGAGSRQRAKFKAGRTDREASEAPASGPACRAFRGIPDGEPADVKGKVVGSSPAWGANRRLAALRAISRRFSKPPPSACPFYTSSERLPACLPIGQAPLAEFRAIQRPESKNGAVSFLDEKRNRLGWETHRCVVGGRIGVGPDGIHSNLEPDVELGDVGGHIGHVEVDDEILGIAGQDRQRRAGVNHEIGGRVDHDVNVLKRDHAAGVVADRNLDRIDGIGADDVLRRGEAGCQENCADARAQRQPCAPRGCCVPAGAARLPFREAATPAAPHVAGRSTIQLRARSRGAGSLFANLAGPELPRSLATVAWRRAPAAVQRDGLDWAAGMRRRARATFGVAARLNRRYRPAGELFAATDRFAVGTEEQTDLHSPPSVRGTDEFNPEANGDGFAARGVPS